MRVAFVGAALFDGTVLRADCALVMEGARVAGVVPEAELGAGVARVTLEGGVVSPGFVDLQVNGGGGVMLNDAPSAETVRTIAAAHRALGTAALMPTLISDRPEAVRAAVAAVETALAEGVPGVAGLHLEGPHLDPARKGAHAAEMIRPMEEGDLAVLEAAAARLPALMVTVAPEAVTPGQVAALTRAGVRVWLGHSDCDHAAARACFEAGAVGVTHLFNAMSQMQGRAPGLVGAALASDVAVGLIADGVHVHPAGIATAFAAKRGRGGVCLVTDAMACAGTDLEAFTLHGRRILRADGRLTLEDGTLAGADLTLPQAVRVAVEAGVPLDEALRAATAAPAARIGAGERLGHLRPGMAPRPVHLDGEGRLTILEDVPVPA